MSAQENAASLDPQDLDSCAVEVAADRREDRPKAVPSLLEQEAIRFAESLDDYEHVSVTDIGGDGGLHYWLIVHDHRIRLSYKIASHCDYWDFVSSLVRSSVPSAADSRREDRKSSRSSGSAARLRVHEEVSILR